MSTRQRLVETASSLFAERGYTATGMAEILAKSGVHRGSLYHAFPAKKFLLMAVLERYQTGIERRLLEPAWNNVSDPIERVFALLDRYRQFLVETECVFGCPIGSLALELHDPDPEVRQSLAANFETWITHVEGCYRAAAERFPQGTDPRQLALFTLTTMEGAVMLARTYRSLAPFDTAIETLRHYIDGLVRARKSESRNSER